MHGVEIFTQLSILIVLVTLISVFMHRFKQPLILGYILAGLIVGTLFPLLPGDTFLIDTHSFDIFSSLGIVLILFIIGLGLHMSEFKQLGSVVFITALAIFIVLGGIGLGVMQSFGFGFTEALIAGVALFFSSTIVIVKILSDKNEHTRLHGQISIGVILVDDIVATIALLFVAAGQNGLNGSQLIWLGIKGAILVGILVYITIKLLPRLSKLFARNQELLFLFTMAWGLGVASIFQAAGFSIEVGALFAGVCLASLPYTQQMESRLRPLRDFFVVIFFITLGASLSLSNLADALIPALILSALVLALKPVVVVSVLTLFGYTRRTSFKSGINLSQISEFSVILMAVAGVAGLVSIELTAVITIVALVTIALSTYMMQYDDKIFTLLEKRFAFFRTHDEHNSIEAEEKHSLILLGYKRGGHEFVKTFKQMEKGYVVIDYNPAVIESLERLHIPHMYGDATDIDLLRDAGARDAELIVSVIDNFKSSTEIVSYIHRVNPKATLIVNADDHDQAAELYRLGASYVLLPQYIGSRHLNAYIRDKGISAKAFDNYRQDNLFGLTRHK